MTLLVALPSLQSLIYFAIYLVVVCVVLYVIFWALGQFSVPPPIRTAIWIIIGLVLLLVVLNLLGVLR
jgi:hypothetical protein